MPKFIETQYQENFPGSRLTPDEVEFAMAVERYRRLRHRPFPTWHEVLRIVRSLGYRKQQWTPPAPPVRRRTPYRRYR